MVVFPGNEQGGAATHIVAYAESVAKSGLQDSIRFLSLGEGPLLNQLQGIFGGIQVVTGSTTQRVQSLRQMMRHHGTDTLWHAHGPRTNVVVFAAMRGLDCRWTSTVQSNPQNDFLGSRLKTVTFTRLNLYCLRRTAGLFVSNRAFADFFPGLAAYFVPNAIGTLEQPPSRENAKSALRKYVELDDEAQVVGIVARLDPVKDISTAIKALSILRNRLRNPIHLVIAGDGEQRSELESQVKESGLTSHVHFLGFINDVSDLYPAFDVHVLPSKSEGVPYVVLEAGVHGVPNIGSDIPGNRNLIHDNVTGWLFPVGDAKALADKLETVLTDRAQARSCVDAFTQTVLPKFSHEAMLEAYLTGYRAMGFTLI